MEKAVSHISAEIDESPKEIETKVINHGGSFCKLSDLERGGMVLCTLKGSEHLLDRIQLVCAFA